MAYKICLYFPVWHSIEVIWEISKHMFALSYQLENVEKPLSRVGATIAGSLFLGHIFFVTHTYNVWSAYTSLVIICMGKASNQFR